MATSSNCSKISGCPCAKMEFTKRFTREIEVAKVHVGCFFVSLLYLLDGGTYTLFLFCVFLRLIELVDSKKGGVCLLRRLNCFGSWCITEPRKTAWLLACLTNILTVQWMEYSRVRLHFPLLYVFCRLHLCCRLIYGCARSARCVACLGRG